MEKEKQKGFPSWENFDFTPYAKEWKWFAVDKDGEGFLYEDKPILKKEIWNGGLSLVDFLGDFDPTNWQNSLQERK